MIYCIAILLIVLVSFPLQEFVPVFAWAFFSRLMLVHTVFYCAALTVPFPVMLGFALMTGFLWDARYHLPLQSEADATALTSAEIPFGFTIFTFALLGSIVQGVRPLFRKGRWELPVFLVGFSVGLGLLLEYVVINFNRGDFRLVPEFWWKILMTSLYSALISPFLLLWFALIARRFDYRLRVENPHRRHTYDGDAF
ncbi:MAG: hypothetical protein AAF236_02945 [Verrucomicrobiota bacterium]